MGFQSCRLNDVAAQPEVIWSLPQNESQGVRARIDSKSGVQLSLQFSHPMQRENTSKFLNFIEPSSAGVQSVTWRGHDLVDVVFCENTSKGCMDFERFRVGQKYSLEILTGASSYFGMSLAEPDTIWFIPEPYPRVGVINGLGKSVLASHDDADISPEEVILGLDIHPSEAFAAGNSLMLFTNGPADVSSLGEGIKCFEGDVKINCLKSASDEGIQITFPDEFKAPENYQVTLETALSIEGHNWPKQQTISWYTVFYGK